MPRDPEERRRGGGGGERGAGVKEADRPRLGRRSYVQSEEACRCPSLFTSGASLSVPQSKSGHRSNGYELTPVPRRGRCIRGAPQLRHGSANFTQRLALVAEEVKHYIR